MADKSDQYGEGAINSTKNTTSSGGKNIDALEVESNNNNARNGGTMGVTFNQVSSFSFLISLIFYVWYMVQVMSIFSREVFRMNQYKVLYGENWNDDDEYETYMIIFLIASIVFIISTLIQIYVWLAKSFVSIIGKICRVH